MLDPLHRQRIAQLDVLQSQERTVLQEEGVLLMVVVGVRIDILIGTNYIRDAVCISFCLNELLSVVENTSLMGVPFPPAIKKAIDVLQTKVGRTEDENIKEDE